MDDVKMLVELGPRGGVQGHTYLVDHLPSQEQRVMKVIECPDVNYANKLFRQFIALQNLQHNNIASPLDAFVSFDQATAGVNLNVLYKYYPAGSLEELLKSQKESGSEFEIQQVHKWMGQLIDAMLYAHNNGVLHNNLKPSNIYISDYQALVIGDFGVPALLSDMETRTRTTDGQLYKYTELEYLYRIIQEPQSLRMYHAPELKAAAPAGEKSRFCDKTDVFSLGLVFYRINCLSDLPGEYSQLLDDVDSADDKIVADVTRYLLEESQEDRPSLKQLAERPDVKMLLCLEEVDRTSRKRAASANVPHRIVPIEESLENVVENLALSFESENLVRATFRSVFSVSSKPMHLTNQQKLTILNSAQFHLDIQDIQEKFLAILFNAMPFVEEEDDVLCSVDLIKHILQQYRTYPTEENIVYPVLQVLFSIAAKHFGAVHLCQAGGMTALMEVLRAFGNDQYVIKMVSWIVWSCAAFPENKPFILRRDVHKAFFRLMPEVGGMDESLVEAFCACLWSLSSYKEVMGDFKSSDGVQFCLRLLRDMKEEPRIVRNVCLVLANAVELDEICAYTVIAASDVDDALDHIKSVYGPNRDNPELVQALVTLVLELSAYSEIRYELHSLHFSDLLTEVQLFYSANRAVADVAARANANIRAYTLPT